MRKSIFGLWMLLTLPAVLALGITSCAEHDNPVDPNPLADQVKGMWYAQDDEESQTPFEGVPYTRVIQVLNFSDDGTGWWSVMYFDNESSEPVDRLGGKSAGDSHFTYTTRQDGTVSFKLNEDWDMKYYPKSLSARYEDGKLVITADGETKTMEHPNEALAAWLEEQATGGAAMKSFNPNDEDFNLKSWRDQEAIYIYDGAGPETINGRKFSLVALPWYTGGAVESNLPMYFCDKMTPENGWELVLNYCGDTSLLNGNFFAVYNKWMGILRFFTYVPDGFSAGNDHLWRITTSGQTAMYQGLKYGVPLDAQMVDPAAIWLDTNGETQFVSPWAENRSSDGLLNPRAGWWAFDMDMSQYRPGLDMSADKIRLQMCSWSKQQASFLSTIKASIDGDISAEIKQIEDPRASTMRATSEGIQAGFAALSAIGHIVSGDYGFVFSDLGNFTNHAFNCGMEVGLNPTKTMIEGTLNLTMNGTIDTQGLISGSQPVVGIAGPTLPMSKFDTRNTLLGQGVWNLKTSPVVWLTDAVADMALLKFFWNDYNPDMVFYRSSYPSHYCYPDEAPFYFFDPSSIEVELNPDLFPASNVEWTQVDAYCVSRAENGVQGTDNYRKALGLSPRGAESSPAQVSIYGENGVYWQLDFEKAAYIYDFLYYSDNKLGMDYPAIVSTPKYSGGHENNGYYDAVAGRGTQGGMAIEPMVAIDKYRNNVEGSRRTPALEVMVTLMVKLRDREAPLLYVRNYLPEVKTLDMYYNTDQLNTVWQNLKQKQPKGTGINRQSPTYDYAILRLSKILPKIKKGFEAD